MYTGPVELDVLPSTKLTIPLVFVSVLLSVCNYQCESKVLGYMSEKWMSGLDGNNYAINHAVARYMEYMRKERRLELNPKPLYDMRDKTIIMSHNVRTFPKYREDTSEDHDVGNVNILHLTETRISRQETNTRIGGLIEIMRSPVTYDTKSRPIHGSIILISSSVQARPLYQLHSEDVAINAIRLTANRFNFIRVYFSLKAGESNIVPALKKVSESIDFSITTIIMGDFNMDTGRDVHLSRRFRS